MILAAFLILGSVPEAGTAATGGTVNGIAHDVYRDLPVGFTAEGFPFRGNPDAPLTIVEYSDFLCPFCARYFNQTLPTLLEK